MKQWRQGKTCWQPGKPGDGGKDHNKRKGAKMNPGTKAKTIGVILLVAVLIVAAIGVVRANTPGNTAISETSETVVRPPEILRHETLPIILKLQRSG